MYNMQIPSNINIKRLYLVVTRREGYKDSYTRSYNLNVTHQTLGTLENVLHQVGVQNNQTVPDVAIARNLPNIMSINATPLGISEIANGWGTQRLRYIMEVESVIADTNMVNYIQGYTEFHDPSYNGNIDPNMRFFINSIASFTRMVDPISGMFIVKPHSNFNVITGNQGVGYQEVTDTNLKLIRPTDVIGSISDIDTYGSDVGNIYNHADNVAGNVNISNRANNNPIKHFTRSINSYISSKNMCDTSHDQTNILTTAANSVSETNILSIPFIGALHSITGEPSPSGFTLDALSKLDPDIQHKIILIDNSLDMAPVVNTILDTTDTEELYKPNMESVIASTVAQSISGVLIDNLLAEIDFSTTNITGENITAISNARSFVEGIDVTSYVNKVVTNINHILMPEISQNGLITVELFVHSDVLGDTSVAISLNGQPSVVYRFPTFADSLYTPVISNELNKQSFTDDMGLVLDTTFGMSKAPNVAY